VSKESDRASRQVYCLVYFQFLQKLLGCVWLESEVGWNHSILDFMDEMILYYMFGWRNGAVPFFVWLEERAWNRHYSVKAPLVGPVCQ
jgi:hypothetical protein